MNSGKIGTIVQWVIAGFVFLLALVAFSCEGGILSGLLFAAFGLLISPLRGKIYGLLPEKFPNRLVAICLGVVLFIGSFATFPTTSTEVVTTDRSLNIEDQADEAESDDNSIKALVFSDDNDIEIVEGNENSRSYIEVDVSNIDAFSESDVTFVSENPDIAKIEYSKTALSHYLYFKVTGVSVGETEVYAVTKDGTIESEHKKVIVKVDEEKLAKEKEAAGKAEAEKKAAEEAEKKAEEERIAAEKAEAEAAKKEAEEKVAAEVQVAAAEAPANEAVVAQQPSDSQSGSGAETGSGSGNGNNFSTYDNPEQQNTEATYVLNTNTRKFHYPSCKSVKKIKPENYSTSSLSRDEIIAQGYDPCGNCHP